MANTYYELDFIKSNGSQYIDTGIKVNPTTRIKLKFNADSTSEQPLFGDSSISDSDDYRSFINASNLYFDISSGRLSGNTMYSDTPYELEFGNFYVKDIFNNVMLLQGTAVSSISHDTNIDLFRQYDNYGSQYFYAYYKLYYCQIYNNDVLVRDFIPVKRKSDNEICLFDKVNNTFYTNQGTGTFTAGSIIPDPEYKQFLQSNNEKLNIINTTTLPNIQQIATNLPDKD